MRTASWVILTIVGVLTLVGGLVSAGVAHFGQDSTDQLLPGRVDLAAVRAWNPEVATALRGRRATAAAYAAALGTLWLAVVLGPYRRGESWAWWGLLGAALVLAVLGALRLPVLGVKLGAGTPVVAFVVTLAGLLLDVRRLRAGA